MTGKDRGWEKGEGGGIGLKKSIVHTVLKLKSVLSEMVCRRWNMKSLWWRSLM